MSLSSGVRSRDFKSFETRCDLDLNSTLNQ